MTQRGRPGILIFLLAGLATAVHAGILYPVRPGDEVVANDLIVRFKSGVLPASVLPSFLPSAQVSPMNLPNLFHIQVPAGIPAGILALLAAHPLVDFVAPNRVFHTNLVSPNDTDYSDQWGLSTVQAQAAWSIMPAQYLNSSTAGTNRIKVAVLDTGADCTHPDFINSGGSSTNTASGGQLDWSASQAFVATTVAYPSGCPWMDDYGHGTHVTGIVAAATSNFTGVASLGYPLQVVMEKVLDSTGSGNSVTIANAITAAANSGVQVISMSFGGSGYDAPLQLAVDYAWQRNVVVVSAAGNNASNALFYPGDANLGLGISATDSNNNLASFSNYGNGIALAAPGVSILSTLPTYTVPLCCNYGYLSGTSMSTPFVSALAGLVAMATPGISNTAIVQRMQQTAASSVSGGGWNQDFGYGVINAYNAISGAVRPASVGGVVGQVIDTFTPSTSTPIDGAQITINGQTVTTDSSGSGLFRFPSLAPGTYSVSAVASGYTSQSLSVTVAAGADTPMIVAMASSYGHFSGTVTDGGIPVPGAVVQALSAGLIVGVTVADPNGAYILWVPGGVTAYTLQASAAGRTSVASAGVSVGVGGNTVANLTLPRMGTIGGTVVDASSHVVSGAQVLASGVGFTAATTTTAAGTYTLIGLPNSTYSVTASVSGLTPVTQTGVVVSTDVTDVVNLQFSGGLTTVAPPVMSPAGGTFTTGQAVTITTPNTGASIRYTTDGSTPTDSYGTLYSGPIPIGSTTTLKAIAFEAGLTDSSVTSAVYAINVGAPSWYNSAWSSRKPVTIPTTAGSASFANFPVLISLASDANLAASAQASGNDILFTASDGITKLNHEIELYNSANGQLIAWVQVPVLAPGTMIYLYYGNSSASNQQNRTATWNSNYNGVWHLPNGTTLSASDSTGNANNGALQGSPVPAATTGEIDGAAGFNGSTANIQTPLNINTLPITVSAWVYPTNTSGPSEPWSTDAGGWDYGVEVNGGTWQVHVGNALVNTGVTAIANTWVNIA